MLKQRILTAIILIPLFVLLVLKSSAYAFSLITALIVVWGAWEWSLFMGVVRFPHCTFYPLFIFLLLLVSFFIPIPIRIILYITFLWWLTASILVSTYPASSRIWSKSVFVKGLMGIFTLYPCWLALNYIRMDENGVYKILFLFVMIWGADSGAYFIGKKWGKHKLIPHVSPGKTWQGLMGAVLTSMIITSLSFYFLEIQQSLWIGALILTIVTVLFSILGDLFESMMKRNVGLKDSGQVLPGHGGILDRVDSLTSAAPIFALGLLWMRQFYH